MKASKPLPTRAELNALFTVDYEKGQLFWKARNSDRAWSAKHAGKPAGTQDSRGYIKVQIGRGCVYFVHRIIFKLAYDLEPPMIDHIDRNKSNNSLSNLQAANNTSNKHNQKLSRNNTSGCTGVYFVKCRRRWIVKSPKQNGKSKNVGYFKSREEAIQHRIELYGESLCF